MLHSATKEGITTGSTESTYEPQRASDIGAVFQSLAGDRPVPVAELWNNVPEEHKGNIEYLMDMLDWEKNTDPDFATSNRMMPIPVKPHEETLPKGYMENWICYKSPDFSATEVTIMPRKTVFIWDEAAYGCLVVQGHGTMDVWDIETPSMVRFGGLTQDEFFVSEPAARHGVSITNPSTTEPIVILKHFGPGNPLLKLK